MSEITYEGTIEGSTYRVDVIAGGKRKALDPRNDLWDHSPSGFSWGYGGSGPAQLALAILAYQLHRYPGDRKIAASVKQHVGDEERPRSPDDEAVRLHQTFKARVTARLDQTKGFRITDGDVRRVLREMAGLDETPQGSLPGVA